LDELKGFIERHQGRVICKPIYQGFVAGTSNNSAVYTHRVAVSELNDAEQLRACPTLLQEEVRRGRDVRVTFVGDDVYAVAITSSTPGFVDWRAEASGLQYEQIELTSEVETACRELLGRLGLVYGAFDFILADDGTWYFLEVNPVGEWAWLEETLGMPIRESFIRLFVSPSTRRREWPTK
jgi:glutathione synthase/RimK-type ligase-like ATP-grasp enzyme